MSRKVDEQTPWTSGEIAEVQRAYPSYASTLLSPKAAKKKATGAANAEERHTWTSHEVLRLRRLFPHASREDLLKAFPGLEYKAIAKAARRFRPRPM